MSHSDFPVPPPSLDEPYYRISRALTLAAALYAIVGGVITLVGWAFEIRRFTDWNNEGISSFPNTAACVVLAGMSLLLLANKRGPRSLVISRVLASIVLGIGTLTLIEHIFQVNLGIDTMLFDQPWGQRASSALMRMGPPATTSFVVLGVGLLLASTGFYQRRLASTLALGVVAIVSLSIIGYWYGADQLFILPHFTGIALQSSTMIAALSLGLIAALPGHGVMAILRRDDAGGQLARRLMVPIIGIPLLLGWANRGSGCPTLRHGLWHGRAHADRDRPAAWHAVVDGRWIESAGDDGPRRRASTSRK